MTVGTKSVLFGAHCFLYHWLAVTIAWWQLYRWAPAFGDRGWPAILDPRAWLVFFVHDLGYLGRSNMDGPEGECHPFPAARFVSRVCLLGGSPRGSPSIKCHQYVPEVYDDGACWLCPWGLFTLLHSRHLAKAIRAHDEGYAHLQPSRLCAADKLALSYTPWWLYLPGVVLSGEIREYMAEARDRGHAVGVSTASRREWFETMRAWCARWAYEHADGRVDTWTGDRRSGAGGDFDKGGS